MENTATTTEAGKFIYVSSQPSSRWSGSWEYYRSDESGKYEDKEYFDSWSDAYDAGSGAPYANPVGFDWEAVTVEEAGTFEFRDMTAEELCRRFTACFGIGGELT